MPLTIAHLSDVHLGPLPPGSVLKNFSPKRLIGGMSWNLKRHKIHDSAVSSAVVDDIKTHQPDHVLFTGDLVNLAAHEEFLRGEQWLNKFGDASWISMVPGNHDAYVKVSWKHGLSHFARYMEGELAIPNQHTSAFLASGFPYVRLRRNVAIIGLSTAEPQSLFRAGGTLGTRQLAALPHLLRDLKARGYYRLVAIHHPPVPGLAPRRKALTDANVLQEILVKEGAELVVHGHNHREMLNFVETSSGKIPIVGVPSASSNGLGERESGAWNQYEISRNQGSWITAVSIRQWDISAGMMVAKRHFTLPS